MSSVLDINNAQKAFGSTVALKSASFSLQPGEWLALLGPNGAGKTTLVRSIAGRVRLDAGTITLFGVPLGAADEKERAARLRLGIVPQELAVYPLLTARENLECFGGLQGLAATELRDRIDWALQWTGLADRADDRAKTFSGGMKRRLNIACSVLHQPDVILLDEPTVGVDPQSRQRIIEMLQQLRQRGAALLHTTHQLDEAQQTADRIVIIDHGTCIASGTFNELLEQTIGSDRAVTVTLTDEPSPSLRDDANLTVHGTSVRSSVKNIATDLPRLLERISSANGQVSDIHIDVPSLQDVFIHLTGRELRE